MFVINNVHIDTDKELRSNKQSFAHNYKFFDEKKLYL